MPHLSYYYSMEELMGQVLTEITLVNVEDEGLLRHGYISIDKVRKATVQAIVDTVAMALVITEELFQQLGLTQVKEKIAHLADGRELPCIMTSPVTIYWKDRQTTGEAMFIPGAKSVLLGAIPLEAMDLLVDPKRNELIHAHGDKDMCMAYNVGSGE
jgi:clan AA aspartic protease